MKEDLTVVFALIDGSGSMHDMRAAVVDGFNEFITDQKKLPGNVLLSMVQFDSDWARSYQGSLSPTDYLALRYREIHHLKNLKEVEKLTMASYVPNGGTPLLAAMDRAIDELGQDLAAMPEQYRPSKVIFLVITDGQENSSDRSKFSKEKIAAKVKHQINKYNWQFTFIGANQDSFHEAGGMGFQPHATMNYIATYDGMLQGLNAVSASTMSYRSGDTKAMILPNDREEDIIEK